MGKAGKKETCKSNSSEVAACAKKNPKGHRSFLGPGTEEKWYGTHTYQPNGLWNHTAGLMMTSLRERGQILFRGTSALARGPSTSRGRGGGKTSIHCNGDSATAELLVRIILSVTQFSVFGAVSGWCEELAQQISDHSFASTEKPMTNMHEESDCRLSPDVVSILTNPHSTNVPTQGNLLRNQNERFETLHRTCK